MSTEEKAGVAVTYPPHPAFVAAERLAPMPEDRDEVTPQCWARYFAATAFAGFTAFHDVLLSEHSDPNRGANLAITMTAAHSALGAAVAFVSLADFPDRAGWETAGELWDLTPEAGALNGEWEDWLVQLLDRLGINPADIDPRYSAADFRSPSRRDAVA